MQKIEDTAQQFASLFGEDKLKPYLHLLWERMAEGHLCLPLSDVQQEHLPSSELEKQDELQQCKELLTSDPRHKRPFVLHNGKLYLQRYFNYESSIINSLDRLLHIPVTEMQDRQNQLFQMSSFLKSLNANYPLAGCLEDEKTDWQIVAALLGFLNNFTIITGGPGTGKTTTVAKILALLYTAQPLVRVALAAPTGKAAVRMAESLKTQLPSSVSMSVKGLLAFIPIPSIDCYKQSREAFISNSMPVNHFLTMFWWWMKLP